MRLLEVTKSPFGASETVPVRLLGREALSELFHYDLTVLIDDDSLSPKDVLGKPITLEISTDENETGRSLNAMIKSFRALGKRYGNLIAYQFELAPALWLATLNETCRIFQDKNLEQIVEEVLSFYAGQIDYSLNITNATHVREYCVQYNESDFHFLSRLLSQEGCFYFVSTEKSGKSGFDQKLTIGDTIASYVDRAKSVGFRKDDYQVDAVNEWQAGHSMHSAEWRLSDYDPTKPSVNLETTAKANSGDTAPKKGLRYRGLGRYYDRQRGTFLAGILQDQEEAMAASVRGVGTYPDFQPGMTIQIEEAPRDVVAEKSVLISVDHDVTDYSGAANYAATEIEVRYENKFVCTPSSIAFRPPSDRLNMRMRGLQTGVVVGPDSDDIYTDEFGRIRVRFHWDGAAKGHDTSCWMRVVQQFAGARFGAFFIPRVGMEVLIDFIEGDPDRPIVIGCVYNGDNKYPYVLPQNKTQSGWKTISSPNKGEVKINEIKIEDKVGSEHFHMHAGKDFTRIVEHDDTLKVENRQSRTIKSDRTVKITEGADKLQVVKGDRNVHLNKGTQSLNVTKGDYKIDVDTGSHVFNLKSDYKLTISQGNQSTKLSAGASTIEAKTKIEFKVGPTVLTLDPSGLTIKAAQVKIQGQAKIDLKAPLVTIKAEGMANLEAPMTKVTGSGMLMLKGGLVMIN